jgi:hypothetical protein
LKPSGQYVMEDLHYIGGTPAVLKYLLEKGLLVAPAPPHSWHHLQGGLVPLAPHSRGHAPNQPRPARRRGLYFCPFHPDAHASLQVYTAKGRRYAHCLSAHSDCPLARHGRNDAFNVYCIGEDIDAKAALRRLNRRG